MEWNGLWVATSYIMVYYYERMIVCLLLAIGNVFEQPRMQYHRCPKRKQCSLTILVILVLVLLYIIYHYFYFLL